MELAVPLSQWGLLSRVKYTEDNTGKLQMWRYILDFFFYDAKVPHSVTTLVGGLFPGNTDYPRVLFSLNSCLFSFFFVAVHCNSWKEIGDSLQGSLITCPVAKVSDNLHPYSLNLWHFCLLGRFTRVFFDGIQSLCDYSRDIQHGAKTSAVFYMSTNFVGIKTKERDNKAVRRGASLRDTQRNPTKNTGNWKKKEGHRSWKQNQSEISDSWIKQNIDKDLIKCPVNLYSCQWVVGWHNSCRIWKLKRKNWIY